MGKRATTAVFLCGCLVGTVMPLDGGEPLSVRVSPAVAAEPAIVRVVAVVEADDRNRSLEITAESDRYLRSSQIQLEGHDARRVWDFEFRDVPRGNYQVTAILTGTGGRRAAVTRVVMVVSRLPR
jgi:hypothetical protein